MSTEPPITFAEMKSLADLRVFLERLERAGTGETRLLTQDSKLLVFGSTSAPAGLFDPTPLVLVARVFNVDEHRTLPVDETVMIRALLERIARMESTNSLGLAIPPERITVAWAGVIPPRSGWEPMGAITAESLRTVAQEGVARVQNALPQSPGEAVVKTVRAQVWNAEIAEGIPAATAFAAEALGFLRGEEVVRVFTTRSWGRLSTSRGDVFFRSQGAVIL